MKIRNLAIISNENEIINARWPSADWENDEIYDLNNWGHGYYNKKDVSGTLFDYENGEIIDISNNYNNLYEFVFQQKNINPDFDLSGSIINLNVGSFKSYTKIVNSYTLDNSNNIVSLNYDNTSLFKEKHHYYYLENKL